MTQISRDDVLHLAQLSSLQLAEDEIAALQSDIGGILDYIEQLSELNTEGVEPTYQVTDLKNVWRSDDAADYSGMRATLLELAPQTTDNQVQVPKVLG